MALPAAKNLPAGVELKQFGDAEIMGEVFESFAKAMGAGIMMVYAVLVLLFGSFLQPITILFSLPLSIGGAIVALAITSQPVSLPVVIGILMLMGIVTKNAIMLVDFAIEEIRRGVPRTEAIVDAGRKRARPIIMTTIAMIGGMLPSAIAIWRRRRVSCSDGDCGHRRAGIVDAVVPGVRAGGVRRDGRYREGDVACLRPVRRTDRRRRRIRSRPRSCLREPSPIVCRQLRSRSNLNCAESGATLADMTQLRTHADRPSVPVGGPAFWRIPTMFDARSILDMLVRGGGQPSRSDQVQDKARTSSETCSASSAASPARAAIPSHRRKAALRRNDPAGAAA